MNLNRDDIRRMVACPTCGANAGDKCWAKKRRKRREPNHHTRLAAAQKIAGGKPASSKPAKNAPKSRRAKKSDGFYGTWEWKKLRLEAIKIHGQRCQCCGWRPGDTEHGRLVVDHIKPRSKYPSLELDLSNLQCLCNDCNMGKSNIYEDDFRDVDNWLSQIGQET